MDVVSYTEALILGTVQGLTEFLPVSSSGHLVVFEKLLGGRPQESGIAFEVFLHLGTLLSLAIFYLVIRRGQLMSFLSTGVGFWFKLGLACIPAGLVWVTLGDRVEASFNSLTVIRVGFVVTGVALFLAERKSRPDGRSEVTVWDSLVIGTCQSVALLPGISRSGSTIAAGVLMGLKPEVAVGFSFLLAIPAVIGANVAHLSEFSAVFSQSAGWLSYVLGASVSALVGIGAIALVYRTANRARLKYFSVYLWGLAAVLFAVWPVSA